MAIVVNPSSPSASSVNAGSANENSQGASLRDFLELLRGRGEFVTVPSRIDPRYELGAALSLVEAGPALRFDNVAGSTVPVVGNVASSRERLALGLGVEVAGVGAALDEAIAHPIPTAVRDSGLCQEVVVEDGLAGLPVPTFFARETGPYITAGVILARDVRTGAANMSFARLKILGSHQAMLGVSPRHHLGRMIQRAQAEGRDLPFAVAIGVHPAIMLAACLYLGFGDDELECAGALLGQPATTVLTETGGIAVPEDAEIVIEAVARGDRQIDEGLVSEYHGHYHDYGAGYLVEVTRVTRRSDAFLQVIVPGLHSEHLVLGAVAIAAGLLSQLRRLHSGVVDVAVPLSGAGRVSAVISVAGIRPGEAMRLVMACFASVPLVKQVIVVDAPLDPWNESAVAWACAFRVRAERDIHVFPPSQSDRSDPLVRDGAVVKIGIDATANDHDRDIGWELAQAPAEALTHAATILADADIAVSRSPLVRGVFNG